jgi:hypothetical protein
MGREKVKASYRMMACLMQTVRGLEHLKIVSHQTKFSVSPYHTAIETEVPTLADFFAQIAPILQQKIRQNREITPEIIRKFEAVRDFCHLDIYTRRSGEVASRTRLADYRHQDTGRYRALKKRSKHTSLKELSPDVSDHVPPAEDPDLIPEDDDDADYIDKGNKDGTNDEEDDGCLDQGDLHLDEDDFDYAAWKAAGSPLCGSWA